VIKEVDIYLRVEHYFCADLVNSVLTTGEDSVLQVKNLASKWLVVDVLSEEAGRFLEDV
jgi:hypothetical protein